MDNTPYTENTNNLEPQLKECNPEYHSGKTTIGIVSNYDDTDETRLFLTPEACGMLTSSHARVIMQSGAGVDIDFPDDHFTEYGVEIVTRAEALKADIVLSFAPLKPQDISLMRKRSVLLCMMGDDLFNAEVINSLMEHEITLGCLDNMVSHNDESVFADIIDEIDGRSAVMYAQDFLSYTGGGKGVLLAGVAGLNPCEVLAIGESLDICYAARTAYEAGASVTLMNNDISALQIARSFCGNGVQTVAIHPRVLANKIKTADIIFIDNCTRPFEIPKNLLPFMKESVYMLDFRESHPSVCVPRTVAMAMSNVLVNFFEEMAIKNGFHGMLMTTPGVQSGIVTYHGKLVDKLIGSFLGMPCVDIHVILAHTN